jgi:hypothetical protein
MRKSIQVFTICAVLGSAGGLHGQDRWRLELRSGDAYATQDLGEVELGRGDGVGVSTEYRFIKRLALFGGWDRFRFNAYESSAPARLDVEETGYAFGLSFEHPVRDKWNPFLRFRAGGTYCHVETDDQERTLSDTGHGFGWEAGVGLGFAIGHRVDITAPAIRFRSLSRDVLLNGTNSRADLRYLTIQLGASMKL